MLGFLGGAPTPPDSPAPAIASFQGRAQHRIASPTPSHLSGASVEHLHGKGASPSPGHASDSDRGRHQQAKVGWRAPSRLGGYKVGRPLGEGGFGTVY